MEQQKHTIYAVIPIENHDFFIEQQSLLNKHQLRATSYELRYIQMEERKILYNF